MESFKHVSNTWLVAQMINPLIFCAFALIVWPDLLDVYYIPLFLVFSFLFSLAGYVLCILSFNFLYRLKLSASKLFFVWIGVMSVCVVLGIYLACIVILDSRTFFELKWLFAPGILSAIVAACLRFNQFISTIDFLRYDYFLKETDII